MGLDAVELVLDTEKHFDINLPDCELEKIETVESFCNLIRSCLVQAKGFKAPSYSSVYEFVVSLLVNDYDIKRDQVHPYSRLVKDLGLD